MARTSTTVDEKVDPLHLELPGPFAIKPKYEVALPANCTAFIYDTMVKADRYHEQDPYRELPAWRVIVLNKAGRVPRALRDRYNQGADVTYTDPIEVKRYLEKTAVVLSKVKVTTVTDDDPED